MPTGTQINEANAETGMQLVIAEAKTSKYSIQFKYLHIFLYFLLIKSLYFFSFKRQFLVSSIFSV